MEYPSKVDVSAQNLSRIFSKSTAKRFAFIGFASIVIFAVFLAFQAMNIAIASEKIFGWFLVVGIFAFVLAGITYAAAYLEIFGEDFTRARRENEDRFVYFDKKLTSLEADLRESVAALSRPEKMEEAAERIFAQKIRDTIQERISQDVVELAKSEIAKKYAPSIYKDDAARSLRLLFSEFVSGILRQLEKQQRNANFNVYIGMLFAGFGLAVMGFILYESFMRGGATGIKTWDQFVFEFVPKLTFVVLFESIAFFFLQAYREDRGMVRYLRNECTNVESKIMGLLSAVYFGKGENLDAVVASLMATERNFTVKKGERVILEALQKDYPVLFETIVERIVPNFSKEKPTQKSTSA